MARAYMGRGWWVLALCAGTILGCGLEVSEAPRPFSTSLQSDDRIETVSVTLAVGRDGAALDEPVALDLGLGYPLWLHPLGRKSGDTVPFGAVAQTSTAGPTLQPGEQATFTFDVAAAPGQDVLLTTRHLLAATRVGDIRRVGIASPRTSDWVLGDLEIRVNDEVLHLDRATVASPDAEQRKSVARLAEIERELAVLSAQYESLPAPEGGDAAQVDTLRAKAAPLFEEKRQLTATLRVDVRSAGTSVGRDRERLSSLEKDAAERTVLEARLAGLGPWFVASTFRPAWLLKSSAKTASVTVETRAHAGADTLHPVYLRAGGHKYALNGPYEALSSAAGAQTFELDATTLASTDLRSWALGMLGASVPRESVPDRWHAQRVLVQVDGMVVYDSDDDARDRLSLDAVRLIPPAHLDGTAAVVTNAASVREVFLWEAGRGLGLDSSGTGAAPLPAASDPAYPRPESGLYPGAGSGAAPGSWPHASFPPLPGETAPWNGGPSHPGGSGPSLQGGLSWGPQGGSVWGGLGGQGQGLGGGWKLPWLPWGSGSGGGSGGGGKSGSTGGSTTTGKPFQMKDVWISSGWKLNEPFTVEWRVSGDTGGIRHFLVSLRVVRPDQSQGLFKHAAKKPVKVAAGQRSCTVLVDPKFQAKHPYYYLAPVVTAVTKKGGKKGPQSNVGVGPARAVFPAIANTKIQPIPKDFMWKGSTPKPLSVGKAGQSMKHRTACFVAGAATPDAIQIGIAKPAAHVAVRPKHGDRVTIRYEIPSFKGRQLLVGHVGFMGGTIAADKADVEMACTLVGKAKNYDCPVWKGKVSTNASLKLVSELLDAADLGVPMTKAEVRVTFHTGGALDPKCVPGVYGLRCTPVKGTASPTKTVNADLVIDPTATWLVPGDLRDGAPGGSPNQLCLAIRNNGPDAIPANLLREVKVAAKYYVGQCGTVWSSTYGREVTLAHVRVTDLRELSSNGPWKGALPKGGVLRLVPTPPKGHKDLAPDGRLASTLRSKPNESNAWKLFRVWADIKTTGAPSLKESDPNNAWTHTYAPTPIIGKGPLDYEVLLFEKGGFKGSSERYEYDPVTQLHRLVWHLGQMPGKRDMYQKVNSLMLGREVAMRAARENHFYTCTAQGNWPLRGTGGGKSAYRDGVPAIGSLVLFPKSHVDPMGIMLQCRFVRVYPENPLKWNEMKRHVFIPLPEKPSDTVVRLPTLIEELDDEIDTVAVWHTATTQGSFPVLWIKVTLFEEAGLGKQGGRQRTLDGPFATAGGSPSTGIVYWLDDLAWDGSVGVDCAEEVSSIQLELVSGSGK